jgi:hypothetical protein
MSINRTLLSLGAWGAGLLLLTAGPAVAQQTPQVSDNAYAYGNAEYSNPVMQNSPGILPFGPVGFVQKFDPFAPADISDYGTGPKAKVGFFFGYERCYWSIGKPDRATIGDATLDGTSFAEGFNPQTGGTLDVKEYNSLNTSIFTAKGSWGNRWETGFMDVNDRGWLVSVIDHVAQTQNFQYANATVLFNDPNGVLTQFVVNPFVPFTLPPSPNQFVPLAVVPRFPDTVIYNRVVLNGVELSRMYRIPRLHNGSYIDLLYGARWFQVDDTFEVDGYGGVVADTIVRTRIQNNMVGPQIGARWFEQRGRWINSVEARFMLGCNFENFSQHSQFASGASLINQAEQAALTGQGVAGGTLFPNAGNATAYATKVAPLGEIRLQTTYQVTRAVGLKIGYTFLGVNGVNRASNATEWTAPVFGILNPGTRDSLIINGLNFGVEVNR